MVNESGDDLTPKDLREKNKSESLPLSKGKLKIFLGMAAGVGKTYAMLEEAQILRQNGLNILIGIINTHGRRETELLSKNINTVPNKKVLYREKYFDELDLDAILEIRPDIVLIDELAHSNIPGVRNLKRWEDVLEILDNEIDVYTTLNIQHIESLKNIIESLTDINIRETVPDLLFTSNTSIQLIDLTPDELLLRLQNGHVYLNSQSKIAARNFFQKERLTALREITLRYVAEIVDSDLRGMIPKAKNIPKDWGPKEKLLVAISHHPHSQKLIRTARRLAYNLDLQWIALHVNDDRNLSENDSCSLVKNINLAKDLGAEYISTKNSDIALGIKHIVHDHNVNLIIVGRSHKSIYLLNQFSLFERLAKECHDIDMLVVKEEFTPIPSIFSIFKLSSEKCLINYISILCFTALLGVINLLLFPYIGYKIAELIFLSGILLFSLFYTKGPLFASAFFCAILWMSLFASQDELMDFQAPENFGVLFLYFLTAMTAGILSERTAKQKRMLQHHEESTQALYEIVHCILADTSLKDTLNDIEGCLEKTLGGKCEILVKDPSLRPNTITKLTGDEKERIAALWVLENGKEAGLSTSTLPLCQNFYIPVMGFKNPVAVIVYKPSENNIIHNEKNFLQTVGQHLSLYISHHSETISKIA